MAIVTTSSVQQVIQGLPERAQLVAAGGQSYGAQINAANAFTMLITIPTTRAELALQNGEVGGGKSYIIDRVWCKAVTSMASAESGVILAQCIAPGTALVADSANKTIYSLSCKPKYGGKAQFAVASTSVGALTDAWDHLHTINSAINATTNIAALFSAECYGRYIIPPQGTFAMNFQESVSGGTGIIGVEWHEVQLTLG